MNKTLDSITKLITDSNSDLLSIRNLIVCLWENHKNLSINCSSILSIMNSYLYQIKNFDEKSKDFILEGIDLLKKEKVDNLEVYLFRSKAIDIGWKPILVGN
jgi:hypothetical protein